MDRSFWVATIVRPPLTRMARWIQSPRRSHPRHCHFELCRFGGSLYHALAHLAHLYLELGLGQRVMPDAHLIVGRLVGNRDSSHLRLVSFQ